MKYLLPFLAAASVIGCQAVEEKRAHIQDQTNSAVKAKVEEGRRAASKAIDEKVNEAKDAAGKAVGEKIDEAKSAVVKETTKAVHDAQSRMQQGVDPGKGFAEAQKQSASMADQVKASAKLDPKAKAWIESTMANSNQALQSLAIPAMQQAYAKFPEHRVWLEGQVKAAIKSSDGAIKMGWEDILTNWQRIRDVAASQR